jgi:hypothetical protein
MFELTGTAICPPQLEFLEAFWFSTAAEVDIVQPINPAEVIVTEFDDYEVCQVVTCIEPLSDKAISATCCTLILLSQISNPTEAPIVPFPSPTSSPSSSPTASPTASPVSSPTSSPVSSPTATPSSSPTSTPESSPTYQPVGNVYYYEHQQQDKEHQQQDLDISCGTGDRYVSLSPTLPILFELTGTASCPEREEIVDSFWMSMSDQVEIVESKNPGLAVVLNFGQFDVCQVVSCISSTTGKSLSRTCCTTVNTVEGS